MDDVIYRPDVLNQMDDLISRQELLKRTIYNPLHGPYIIAQDVLDCPSAQKKGHWISLDDGRGRYNDRGFKCSECGGHSDYDDNFCCDCGADMREDGETDG